MSDHNPIPFDFVPFSKERPLLGQASEWECACNGVPISGRIEYDLTVKSPLHHVGNQNKNNRNEIEKSCFLKRHDEYIIPGAGIKGMVRAFIEALTNSWVSQATDEYPAEVGTRAHPYNACTGPSVGTIGPVIPAHLHPNIRNGKIDLTSFLFGVVEGGNDNNTFPSRLFFEDIVVPLERIDKDSVRLPDVPGKAFMGGPKPRINNWWYFMPSGISVKTYNGGLLTDFMGKEYWGRKFYYHQNPEFVLAWYNNSANWPHITERRRGENFEVTNNYLSYPVETVKVKTTLSGRIDFNNIPPVLLGLVMLSLGSSHIGHKIGFGQAFGLGSVTIKVKHVYQIEAEGFDLNDVEIDLPLKDLTEPCFANFVDNIALRWLKRILLFDEAFMKKQDYIFTYPPFGPVLQNCSPDMYPTRRTVLKPASFTKLVRWTEAENAAKAAGAVIGSSPIALNLIQAKQVAESLWNTKKTIHLRVYQEKSRLWPEIEKRG